MNLSLESATLRGLPKNPLKRNKPTTSTLSLLDHLPPRQLPHLGHVLKKGLIPMEKSIRLVIVVHLWSCSLSPELDSIALHTGDQSLLAQTNAPRKTSES